MSSTRAKKVYLSLLLVFLLALATAYAAVPALADNWTQVGGNGLGDTNNSYIMSMAVYGGYLYAGTENTSGSGAQLYRSLNGSLWSPVTVNGFGSTNNVGFYSMATFNGDLYVGTRNASAGCEVWKYNGTTWVQDSGGGFGVGMNNQNIITLQTYNGYLYAGIENQTGGAGGGCQVWRSNGGAWQAVVGPGAIVTGGFGDFDNYMVASMAVFDGYLYAGTHNTVSGGEVWRTSDGTSWGLSNTPGFGSSLNTRIISMKGFGGYLYAGTYSSSGGQLWRTLTGGTTDWNKISTSGFGAAAESIQVYDSNLYVGGWNARVKRSVNGTDWYDSAARLGSDSETPCLATFGGSLYAGTGNFSTGGKVWRTSGAPPTISAVSPSSGPPGTSVTITGGSFGNTRGTGEASNGKGASYVSFNGETATEYAKWSDTKIVCSVPDGASAGPVFVVVNGQASNKNKTFTVASPTWYLAEGTTAWGFSDYISIENPNTTAVHASITYMTGTGNVSGGTITLPAKSQTTVNPADKLGSKDFSTKITCTEGKTIAVDRTMSWTGPGAPSPEGHSSVGVTSPAKTWYLPEGSSAWGFECWLLIQNPSTTNAANCTVTYMIEGQGPKTVSHTVPKASRASFDMSKDIGSHDASIKVESNVPVIPERAMYRNNRREGHDSIGTTTPAADYYLAEGATGYNVGYITYVLVQNPQGTPTNVTLTYMTQSGQVAGPSFQMPANSRKTIKVNDQLPPNTDVSTHVHGSQPIIAERAMYWDNGTGEACHDSIGMGQPHTTFYLPDGQSSEGRETWTLVQNPNTTPVTVQISYLTLSGKGDVVKTETIPANSRKTFNMASHSGLNGRASIMVTCKTSGKKIMVERSMYWNTRGAGTDTIGGFSD